jgi:AcrR family transcriptional regulator
MGIAERKVRDKQEIKNRIMMAALQLFHDKGYGNVTIRQIASKIEYSPATIYLYFKDKADIFHSLYESGFKKFYPMQLSTLSIQDPFERLKKHGEIYVQFALENKEFYDIMFIMRVTGFKVKEKSERREWGTGYQSYEFLKQNIKDCINAGYFTGENVDILSFMIWSCVHGISSLIIRDRTAIIPEEYIDGLIKGSLSCLFSQLTKK